MILRVSGDRKKLERFAAENKDLIRGIADRADAHGVIAHRFYGGDGQIMVVDEWPDAASFERFFEQEQPSIDPLMAQFASGEPEVTFWRKLETYDEVGWN